LFYLQKNHSAAEIHFNAVGNTVLTANTWYLVTVVRNATNITLHVNGVLDGYAIDNQDVILYSHALSRDSIGISSSYNFPNELNGSIDELKVYNRTLTINEINNTYHNKSSVFNTPGIQSFMAQNISTGNNFVEMTIESQQYMGTDVRGRVQFSNTTNGYNDTDLSLIGSWHLDNSTTDSSTSGFDGTGNVNCSTNITGVYNTSCHFFDNSYINLGDVLDFPYQEARTFSAWVKVETFHQSNSIISKQDRSSPYDGWTFYVKDNRTFRFFKMVLCCSSI